MNRAAALAAGVLAACLGACSPDAGRDPESLSLDDSRVNGAGRTAIQFANESAPVKTAADYLAEARFAGADLRRGEILSFACRACHGFAAEDPSPLGPSLYGVIGRPAASLQGFDYSRAMRAAGLVWTPEAIDAWLAAPNDFLPGNAMAFTGFRSAADRRDLIAYLLRETAPAVP